MPGRFGVMSFDARAAAPAEDQPARGPPRPGRRAIACRRCEALAGACGSPSPDFLAVDRAALGKPWVARARAAHAGLQLDDPHARSSARKPQVHADALIWEADGRP